MLLSPVFSIHAAGLCVGSQDIVANMYTFGLPERGDKINAKHAKAKRGGREEALVTSPPCRRKFLRGILLKKEAGEEN